ncbi:ornithine carbamoyltransferase [Hypnocyclicus thermotrophus]|uniref:Ornithine carbamoyltransferase n=1 Tax=Hypnocyclicus thermotrophus TaxID=1627895 RepID=A0AA46E085_9FUSO|nr:ornithine carbamoyltransferase [Hypnocyclicus thermotrophus]TDT72285.1 ornithine carbamoyltransferase [Hypnocyclicus thermotrophus]
MKGRSFLTLLDYTKEEIFYLIELAKKLKTDKKNGKEEKYLKNKNIVLLFEKDSTRTRCAFEVGAYDQGANVTYIGSSGSQIGKKESIKDTARVLGRMYDGIEYRGYTQEIVETLAEYSKVPVWNGLTTEFHPTQVLADLLTIKEHFGKLEGLNFTYFGDGRNNMANSLMIGCAKVGINFRLAAPRELWPEEKLINEVKDLAKTSSIQLTENIEEATKESNIIYTDVWVSMGEPEEVWDKRIKLLKPYQVNKKIMDMANKNAIFLHCLPSFHDLNTKIGQKIYNKYGLECMEVTDEVFESEKSLVFDEAENRVHTIKAVMVATLHGKIKL